MNDMNNLLENSSNNQKERRALSVLKEIGIGYYVLALLSALCIIALVVAMLLA